MSNWSRDSYGVTKLTEVSSSAAISSNTLTIDMSKGTTFYTTLNADINTMTITNVPTPGVNSFTLVFTADGTARAITWAAAISWPGASIPVLTSTNGKIDIFSFLTLNGGTNWYGFTGGQNY